MVIRPRGVAVVGAVNVDMVVTTRRLPGPGETVVGPDVARFGGGKGANAAVAAARFGAPVRYVGAIGADDLGATAVGELRAEGIDVTGVAVDDGAATGVALIVVDERGENQIAVGAGANGRLGADTVLAALAPALPTLGCVLVSTEIPADAVAAAVGAAAAAGVRCVLNPAPVLSEHVALLDHGPLDRGPLLTPNTGELRDLAAAAGVGPSAARDDAEATAARASAVCALTGSPVVVTLGGDGALVVTPAGELVRIPARPATVRDTTGAGDTFNGVLAACLAAGASLVDAAETANTAAALSVAVAGARGGMPSAAAVSRAPTCAPARSCACARRTP